jgi:hypothetical protein
MRIPRCLVMSLLTLSALSVLGAGAWWWVTWPVRTVREFHELIRNGRRSEAVHMVDFPELMTEDHLKQDVQYRILNRWLSEMLVGELRFQLYVGDGWGVVGFYTAQRGRILPGHYEDWSDYRSIGQTSDPLGK